ncbi:MAG: hypothetical protein WC758_08420 [Candidatus Woesearchaeota archaeon]|jgi:hypothetical protein
MNKKGKTNNVMVGIIIIALVIAAYFIITTNSNPIKTVNEHKQPADISQSEKGTGLDLKLYDCPPGRTSVDQCEEVVIPDWFKVASISPVGEFTVVKHSDVTCTTKTSCVGYATNPRIDCWTGVCALKSVTDITMGVSVTNPSSSQLSFTNVAPTAGLPAVFYTSLGKTATARLSPGQTSSWVTGLLPLAVWEGTTQTFSTTVTGTNEYTGAAVSASDSMQLTFGADPTGALVVSVISPV